MVYASTGLEMMKQGDSPAERASIRGRSEIYRRDRAEFILEVIRQRDRQYAEGVRSINNSRDEEIAKLKKMHGFPADQCEESEKEKRLKEINTAYNNAHDAYEFLRYDFKGNLDGDIKVIAEGLMQKLELESVVLSIEIYEEKFRRGKERQKESVERMQSFVEEMWDIKARAESERASLIGIIDDFAKKTASSREHYGRWLKNKYQSPETAESGHEVKHTPYSIIKGLGSKLCGLAAFL